MSSIVIRNIIGTGPFAMPTTDSDLEALNAATESIAKTIPLFRCLSAKGNMIAVEGEISEVIVIIGNFSLGGSIVPSCPAVRSAITTAFLADPAVTSIGEIEIKLVQEGGFYNRYPIVSRIDDVNGIVHFSNAAPPGAQIEVYKYTPHTVGNHDGYTSRIGKRYRPARLLAEGATQCDLSIAFLTRRRNHFRFAFRWPVQDNTGGPGVRGPLSTTSISTATPRERTNGSLIVINPAPSGFGKH